MLVHFSWTLDAFIVTHVPVSVTGDIFTCHFPNYIISVLNVSSASFLSFIFCLQVLFPMFQELAPHDPHNKCGHHYAICLDLKNQRFEVLDSMRSEAGADLTMHDEYFINNLKETWNRHYENSKVQIRHFPIEYVATTKQGNT